MSAVAFFLLFRGVMESAGEASVSWEKWVTEAWLEECGGGGVWRVLIVCISVAPRSLKTGSRPHCARHGTDI